jgi:hypothetical protein
MTLSATTAIAECIDQSCSPYAAMQHRHPNWRTPPTADRAHDIYMYAASTPGGKNWEANWISDQIRVN